MSDGAFPLLNRPVATPPGKSFPYGAKSHRVIVFLKLLFPVSIIESPNTNNAGIKTFSGSSTFAFVSKQREKKNIKWRIIMEIK